jgi:hypothetical protein
MSTVHDNIKNWGNDFDRLAADLGIEAAALHAVAAAEVGSLPPPPIGLPVIRFEVHSILRMSNEDLSSVIELRDAPTAWHADAHWYKNDPDAEWERVHSGSQADEWGALAATSGIDPTSAMKCASYGVGQLMGWHYKTLGYETVQEMVADALLGPSSQFDQWGKFFKNKNDGALLDSMRNLEWREFARVYNGPGQVDYYGAALDKHYNKAKKAIADGFTQEEHIKIELDTWEQRQMSLVALGYDPGPIDGSFGPSTKKAVKEFQAYEGLTADGIWGAKTERTMQAALKKAGEENS